MVSISMEAGMVSPVGDGVLLAISTNVGVPSLLYKTLFSLLGVSEVTFFSDVSAISDLVSMENGLRFKIIWSLLIQAIFSPLMSMEMSGTTVSL